MIRAAACALLLATPVLAQTPAATPAATPNPFATPIAAEAGVIRVDVREFAAIPDIAGVAARMMKLVPEPGGTRYFVNDMRGPIYTVSSDGARVAQFIDINDPKWGIAVQSQGRERGMQAFALHPQFNARGTPGYGKFYTWSDVVDTVPAADFVPKGGGNTHDTVLLEWTARTPGAGAYDGGAPRELLRAQQPYSNHNGGDATFNPYATGAEANVLYIGLADGGSGGDPQNHSQDMASAFGKILRIDPLGKNSRNGKYGIPASNPFVRRDGALAEIYALGVRNPQRFGWDPSNGKMYMSDIGQNIVEEISPVTSGANLGWNVWEGSFRYAARGVDTTSPRSDPAMTYPIAEYDHTDPLMTGRAAVTGVVVVRSNAVPALRNRILFADNPSGEVFHVSADNVPAGGQDVVQRVLFNDGGQARTLLELVKAKNTQQGKTPAARPDLRISAGRDGQVFLLNKADGVVRLVLAPAR